MVDANRPGWGVLRSLHPGLFLFVPLLARIGSAEKLLFSDREEIIR